ncbi:MAG: inorganic phosphate transporter [bacterium]
METYLLIIVVVFVALSFDFANGWNDSANAIAAVVSTRVLSPLQAVLMAGTLNFVGAYFSTRVAMTIGKGIVDPTFVTQYVTLFAMLAAVMWVALATYRGLPVSSSHSLIGGLVGAAIGHAGLTIIKWKGLTTVLVALLISPVLGMCVGYIVMSILKRVLANCSYSKVNRRFGKFQILSSSLVALMHGTNDAQKVMGIVTLALFSGGYIVQMQVPFWVMAACATAIALGTSLGGWRVVKTVGTGLMDLRPIHGSVAETSAAAVLFTAATLGVPVSTTHVVTSSIVGVGAAKRKGGVRWVVGKKILYAWVLTLPFCFFVGFGLMKAFHFLSARV